MHRSQRTQLNSIINDGNQMNNQATMHIPNIDFDPANIAAVLQS